MPSKYYPLSKSPFIKQVTMLPYLTFKTFPTNSHCATITSNAKQNISTKLLQVSNT